MSLDRSLVKHPVLDRSAPSLAGILGVPEPGSKRERGGRAPTAPSAEATALQGHSVDMIAQRMSLDEWHRVFVVCEIVPGLFHVRASNSLLLSYAFLRFQEHYECPHYAGKVFCREDFQRYYASRKPHGTFTYYSDWTGFNFPGSAITSFRTDPRWKTNKAEQAVLCALAGAAGEFYVIGTALGEDEDATFAHEVAHGFWHLDRAYRESALAVLQEHDLLPLKLELMKGGYREEVLDDECHAYLIDGVDTFVESSIDLKAHGLTDTRPYRRASRKLKKLLLRSMRQASLVDNSALGNVRA